MHEDHEHRGRIEKIIDFYRSRKRMPSYAEIMALVGFKSKNAVYRLVGKLVDEGIVGKDASGRLIPKNLAGMANELPFLGLVEAGFPSTAEEISFDTMDIDEYLVGGKSGQTYLLEVKGDSMIDAGIHEGDLVVAERTLAYGGSRGAEAKDGDIVIANMDGGWTMKYFRTRRSRDGSTSAYLEAANKRFKPMYPEESLKIAAIVKGVVRKY